MAWEEQRDLRARRAAERGGPPTEPTPAPRPGAAERLSAFGGALRRNGTAIAVGLSAAALLLSGIALIRSGDDGSRGAAGVDSRAQAAWQGGGDGGWRGGPGTMGHRGR
jgi:hypothetical protein